MVFCSRGFFDVEKSCNLFYIVDKYDCRKTHNTWQYFQNNGPIQKAYSETWAQLVL
jgi:hypothetical protein